MIFEKDDTVIEKFYDCDTQELEVGMVSTEILEEDEDGIPIKYRDKIMAMSKETNKRIAERWNADLCKDEIQ